MWIETSRDSIKSLAKQNNKNIYKNVELVKCQTTEKGVVSHCDNSDNEVTCKCDISWFSRTCVLQSGEVVESSVPPETQEITQFTDMSEENIPEIPAMEMPGAKIDKIVVGELRDFLSRPVRISNLSWTEAQPAGVVTTLDPWTAYLNNVVVRKKLDNFAWFRANMRIKIVVTASPFYYGLMMASYKPLPGFMVSDDFVATLGTIPRSQRPHVMILPADSLGGSLTLSFVYPANFVDLQTATDVASLGLLTYEIISVLQSANGATGQPVSVQTYAWLEDVDVQGPSVGLALQSKTVLSGPVSSVASSVAKFANVASTWPFVGRFMKATEVGAKAIGDIASMFGFTNLPVLTPAMPFRSVPFPPLASTGVGYPVEKLTGDPHAELAIDGAPANLDLEDELQISHFVQRASYLDKAVWTTATLTDAQLLRVRVSPKLLRTDNQTTYRGWYHTPMSFVGSVFKHWRGDIIYRFDFIKTKYHRGRVLITWDPTCQATNNVSQIADVTGRTITKIVDLGVESSVEIRVPYGQNYPWRETGTSVAYVVNGADTNPGAGIAELNGILVMRVLNVLTAPVATSSIDVIISVRGAENLEFNNPINPLMFSPWKPQSKEIFETPALQEVMGVTSTADSNRFLVNMGESFKSIRELLRRTMLNEIWEEPSNTTDALYMIRHRQTRFPLAYGYDPNGLWTAKGLVTPASDFPFNYTLPTYLNWFAPCFLGIRGSMFWTYNFINQSTIPHAPVRVTRATVSSSFRTRSTQLAKTGANDAYFWWANTVRTGSGAALIHTSTQSGLSVSIPNYNHGLFQSTEQGEFTTPTGRSVPPAADRDGAHLDVPMHSLNGGGTRGVTIEKYCGAGTDLSLLYFVNCPVIYEYMSTPAP